MVKHTIRFRYHSGKHIFAPENLSGAVYYRATVYILLFFPLIKFFRKMLSLVDEFGFVNGIGTEILKPRKLPGYFSGKHVADFSSSLSKGQHLQVVLDAVLHLLAADNDSIYQNYYLINNIRK